MKNEGTKAVQDLPLEELWPLIDAVFAKGGRFRLFPRGDSMLPLIHAGVDSVLIEPPQKFSRHDILLYRRANGQFVLHRLMRIDKSGLTMCGDNQYFLEKNVSESAILGRVCGIYFEENYLPIEAPALRRYAKRRAFSRPFRRLAAIISHRLHFKNKQ